MAAIEGAESTLYSNTLELLLKLLEFKRSQRHLLAPIENNSLEALIIVDDISNQQIFKETEKSTARNCVHAMLFVSNI